MTIPLIIMVLIFQHRIVAGLTAGGVRAKQKGCNMSGTIPNRPSSYGIPDWAFLVYDRARHRASNHECLC